MIVTAGGVVHQGIVFIPFYPIANFISFIPIGIFIKYLSANVKSRFLFIGGFLGSRAIETIQYIFSLGVADINDVIMKDAVSLWASGSYRQRRRAIKSKKL